MSEQRNGHENGNGNGRRRLPHRMALLCISYSGEDECKVERLILPTGIRDQWAEKHRERAAQYKTIGDVLQDFWVLASAEAPEGEFMWFHKRA